jgi:hypothetical protein
MLNLKIIPWLGLALLTGNAFGADEWRTVVPSLGEPFDHAPPSALALRGERPEGLKETVRYRGSHRRYAHLIYGRGRTAGVAIVLDEIGPGRFDLYVDANRDNTITDKDRMKGEGLSWRAPLAAVLHEGDVVHEYPRTVFFRYGPVSRSLAVATCGYLEGRTRLGDREVTVRRVDGDANGLFGDSRDRVWVDVNGDGKWDEVEEQFLFTPIVRLNERRFAVRADDRGQRLAFAVLEGTGKVRLALPRGVRAEQVEEIQATVQSRDGVTGRLNGLDQEVSLPAGEYRLTTVLLSLKDPKGDAAWGFVFNDNGGKEPRWHTLTKNGSLTLEPVGALDFSVDVQDGKTTCRPGDQLSVRPGLYTADGLLIERAYRGRFESNPFGGGCHGTIRLRDGERVLDTVASGFA